MTIDQVLVTDAQHRTLARITPGRDGWDWRCGGCKSTGESFLSASAALADFEAHVERRHP